MHVYDISGPADIRQLSIKELEALAAEIRAFLIESISRTGGHLSSNLGIVELTLALHVVFDSPRDRILFDVGHQSYVHKILTGRGSSLRCGSTRDCPAFRSAMRASMTAGKRDIRPHRFPQRWAWQWPAI